MTDRSGICAGHRLLAKSPEQGDDRGDADESDNDPFRGVGRPLVVMIEITTTSASTTPRSQSGQSSFAPPTKPETMTSKKKAMPKKRRFRKRAGLRRRPNGVVAARRTRRFDRWRPPL
jgi:hypothetical protein